MKNTFPPERTTDDTQDAFYSEELSRAAVGRLFDDAESDDPPAIKSAFVTGFDRTPASEDENPTKKREKAERPDRERSESERPERAERERPERDRPARPERDRTERDENARFKPREQQEAADEPQVERHRRRETATSRLLGGENHSREESFDEQRRERPDRPGRRRNPAPKPAVRVNVEHDEDHPSEGDLDTFRRRYNSGELVSPPRNPNRPVRGRGDVRTNRMRTADHDEENISPARLIAAVAAIAVLVVVSILTFQMISFRSRYNDASATIAEYREEARLARGARDSAAAAHETAIEELQTQVNDLENLLWGHDIDPNQPTGSEWGTDDSTTADPPPAASALGTTITVPAGSSGWLSNIARRYYGNANQATLDLIMAANNITNPDHIQAGQSLYLPIPPG